MDNDNVYVFCIFLYYRMYNYMYLFTNKGKIMTKITIRLMIPILRIQIVRLAMSTNFTQNWKEHCTVVYLVPSPDSSSFQFAAY